MLPPSLWERARQALLHWLCSVGLHDWTPWYSSLHSFYKPAKLRHCRRCKFVEFDTSRGTHR